MFEGGKLNQLKNKEMEVFTSDVVQFGVDVVDNSSRGSITSRSGAGMINIAFYIYFLLGKNYSSA